MCSVEEERFRSALLEWGAENVREFPWREKDRSLYEVFVAEFFLTQTPAENVSSVYPEFLDEFPSLGEIESACPEELVEIIEPLGFYNMRSKALKSIAADHDTLPVTRAELVELPGVGEYVANATLCFAKGEPRPVLDRNVDRVYRRVFGDNWPESPDEQIRFTERLVPEDEPRMYNFALLDFGAAVCGPQPSCEVCFATEYCDYYQENVVEASPERRP